MSKKKALELLTDLISPVFDVEKRKTLKTLGAAGAGAAAVGAGALKFAPKIAEQFPLASKILDTSIEYGTKMTPGTGMETIAEHAPGKLRLIENVYRGLLEPENSDVLERMGLPPMGEPYQPPTLDNHGNIPDHSFLNAAYKDYAASKPKGEPLTTETLYRDDRWSEILPSNWFDPEQFTFKNESYNPAHIQDVVDDLLMLRDPYFDTDTYSPYLPADTWEYGENYWGVINKYVDFLENAAKKNPSDPKYQLEAQRLLKEHEWSDHQDEILEAHPDAANTIARTKALAEKVAPKRAKSLRKISKEGLETDPYQTPLKAIRNYLKQPKE